MAGTTYVYHFHCPKCGLAYTCEANHVHRKCTRQNCQNTNVVVSIIKEPANEEKNDNILQNPSR